MSIGPSGSSDATNTSPTRRAGHFTAAHVHSSTAQNVRNKIPCANPTYRTGIGCPAAYFSGIATKTSTMNENASSSPTVRKTDTGFRREVFTPAVYPLSQ